MSEDLQVGRNGFTPDQDKELNFRVMILPSRDEFWAGPDEDVLTAALRRGVRIPYGCRHGNCGTCKHLLIEGKVYECDISPYVLTSEERNGGAILLCSTLPRSDLVIERFQREADDGAAEHIPPRRLSATVASVATLSPALVELRVRPARPLPFWAGQYVELRIPGTSRRRSLSIASPPSSAEELALVFRRRTGNTLSALVDNLRAGDVLDLEGPFGHLRFVRSGRPVIMVALGHGIAPLLSILQEEAEEKLSTPITLYHGGSSDERPFAGLMAEFSRALPGFELVEPAESSNGDRAGQLGQLTKLVGTRLVDASGYDAYLSGSPAMCDALAILLAAKGLPEHRIYIEKFYPAVH